MKFGIEEGGLFAACTALGVAIKAATDRIRAKSDAKKTEVEADVTRVQINATVDQQQFDQHQAIINTYREMLIEERLQRSAFQETATRLAEELSAARVAQAEMSAELKLLRAEVERLRKQIEKQNGQRA